MTYIGCITVDGDPEGTPWCSTKVDPNNLEHDESNQYYGDCNENVAACFDDYEEYEYPEDYDIKANSALKDGKIDNYDPNDTKQDNMTIATRSIFSLPHWVNPGCTGEAIVQPKFKRGDIR